MGQPHLTPPETYDTQNIPSHNSIENMGADDSKHNNQIIVGCRKLKSEAQRKRELKDDEYTCSVHGCEKEISLDKRPRYYPELWTKHRRKCQEIKKIESAEQHSTAASSFEISGPRLTTFWEWRTLVKATVSRQTELSCNEGQDREIRIFLSACLQRGDRPWAYCYSTTKEIEERKIGTVYFDTYQTSKSKTA
ncbi:uncharacterized protein BJ212DRAFT_1491535 [Suillus subaureus]|uniref:Uncharacterized protein n=1 Tax=Suillus subaureus TaxID=48587 RepID=A0A9P7EN96_9AGAM|nr:uncharacterized protein BJ212DRAFT_1491535 [Suillus subaureus]KAG1826788.1 hypothetical protein BJ212DRAFT_1491535 [Suillus subaureus]